MMSGALPRSVHWRLAEFVCGQRMVKVGVGMGAGTVRAGLDAIMLLERMRLLERMTVGERVADERMVGTRQVASHQARQNEHQERGRWHEARELSVRGCSPHGACAKQAAVIRMWPPVWWRVGWRKKRLIAGSAGSGSS